MILQRALFLSDGGKVFFGWWWELIDEGHCLFEFGHSEPDLVGTFSGGDYCEHGFGLLLNDFQALHSVGSSSIFFEIGCHLSFLYRITYSVHRLS